MTDKKRNLIIGIVALLASLGVLLTQYTASDNPQPAPSPTPSISAVPAPSTTPSYAPPPSPSPTPSVSSAPSPKPSQTVLPSPSPSPITPSPIPSPSQSVGVMNRLSGLNETVSFLIPGRTDGTCVNLVPVSNQNYSVKFFELRTVTTTRPSFSSAAVGAYEDPLFSTTRHCSNKLWVDVAVSKTASIGSTYEVIAAGITLRVKVVNFMIPDRPSHPLYAEMTFENISSAHGLADEGSNLAQRGALNKLYRDFVRAHRLEPIKQGITTWPNSDVNYWSAYGVSPKQTIIDGAISAPCLFGPGFTPTAAQMSSLNSQIASGVYPSDSWGYAFDEGEYTRDAEALAAVKVVRSGMPNLKVMITRQEWPEFVPYVDFFVPVLDWFKVRDKIQLYTKPYGLYTSCMANGTCNNAQSPGTPSGVPMAVLDAPPVHFRAFMWVDHTLGAKFSLYFKITKMLRTALQPGGQLNEGGNGDGTRLYADTTTNTPVASLWLKKQRQSSYDVEYLIEAKKRGISFVNPVKDQFNWSKNEADYDNVINTIKASL